MSPVSEVIFQAAKACGNDFRLMAEVIPAAVRAWADEQDNLPDPIIPPAEPFEVDAMGGVR